MIVRSHVESHRAIKILLDTMQTDFDNFKDFIFQGKYML
jgi:hypothetical protein